MRIIELSVWIDGLGLCKFTRIAGEREDGSDARIALNAPAVRDGAVLTMKQTSDVAQCLEMMRRQVV